MSHQSRRGIESGSRFVDVPDYRDDVRLRILHRLSKIRYLPLKGMGSLAYYASRVAPYPRPAGACVISTVHGLVMMVDPVQDTGLERSLFFYGTYEEGTLEFMRAILRAGDVFIDVGANIGLMSLQASRLVGAEGRVLAYEPLDSTHTILAHNLALNDLTNVETYTMALGAEAGEQTIYDDPSHNRGAAGLLGADGAPPRHRVPVQTLDYEAEVRSLPRVSCLKIDVEGWEMEVLKGARGLLSGKGAPACIIECSSSRDTYGATVQDIYAFIRAINEYRIFRGRRGKEIPDRLVEIERKEDLPRHDNLYCLLPRHLEDPVVAAMCLTADGVSAGKFRNPTS